MNFLQKLNFIKGISVSMFIMELSQESTCIHVHAAIWYCIQH